MRTPIYDFVSDYMKRKAVRLHMPAHKGKPLLGIEGMDITEISGADSLYFPSGIIKESEENASALFDSETFYSTEGSSHCIRAMLYLAYLYSREHSLAPLVLAARNIHKSFVSAVFATGMEVDFLSSVNDSYLSSLVTAEDIEEYLETAEVKPCAVYITTPDYLGNIADVENIARACKKHGMLLLVDNAHGAYLQFLKTPCHPIVLGADLVCDSAHKTLPALTGAAYLHIAKSHSDFFSPIVKEALLLFGSTSPSYLTLLSLDLVNRALDTDYRERLALAVHRSEELKKSLISHGYTLFEGEPLKITILAKAYGYLGTQLAEILEKENIFAEFMDRDYLVLMTSADTEEADFDALESVLLSVPRLEEIKETPPTVAKPPRKMTVRDAHLATSEDVDVSAAIGRVVSTLAVSCPPAIPVVVSGEVVDADVISALNYYGIKRIRVVK